MDMDLSSMWLPELEMEDPGMMNYNVKRSKPCDPDSISSESYTENESLIKRCFQSPEEQAEMKLSSSNKNANGFLRSQTQKPLSSSNTFTISFGDKKPEVEIQSLSCEAGKVQLTMARGPVQAQDHVLAERKRREKLNQLFISMSSLLPNLKKMDKASVLEDATNYIRELQERVKELESVNVKQSVISLKRSRLSDNDEYSFSKEITSSHEDPNCADIDDITCNSSADVMEVRMSGCSVLVRIQSCKYSCNLLAKAVSVLEKLGLSIISSSCMPFANTTTLVTIVAQFEDDDLLMTATDLVKNLQLAFST